MNKTLLFIVGFLTTAAGISLVLRFWEAVIIVFSGIFPAVIAVFGLVLMFAASLKK